MSEENAFHPENMQDGKCRCPEPDPNEDETKCLKCGGPDPKIVKKKKRVKKK